MKKLKYFLIILVLLIGVFCWFKIKEGKITEIPKVADGKTEFCYALISQPNDNGFYDKYTLRLALSGENTTGQINFVPAEKDSKVGKFEGVVGPIDKTSMTRTATVWWDTFGEGISAKEQLKFIFNESSVVFGAGELVDRGDGVFIYKDPDNLHYSFSLESISCLDLNERENVESYLKNNIVALSPVKAVLGGTWHIIYIIMDLEKKFGTITYEDGHIQEKKNFSYTTNKKREIENLTIY